jgi:hypothetical protein
MGVEIQLHTFLTWTLDGGDWSASHPAPPPHPLGRKLGGSHSCSGRFNFTRRFSKSTVKSAQLWLTSAYDFSSRYSKMLCSIPGGVTSPGPCCTFSDISIMRVACRLGVFHNNRNLSIYKSYILYVLFTNCMLRFRLQGMIIYTELIFAAQKKQNHFHHHFIGEMIKSWKGTARQGSEIWTALKFIFTNVTLHDTDTGIFYNVIC